MNEINTRTDESAELLQRIIRENLEEIDEENLIGLTIKILNECDDFIESSRQTHDLTEISHGEKALKTRIQSLIENYSGEAEV